MAPNLTPAPGGGTALSETGRPQAAELTHVAPYLGSDPAREYLQFIFGVLRRRCWFLVIFVATAAACAFMVANQIKPLYQADTQLVLEAAAGRSAASGLQALLGSGSDLESETEVAILTSLTMAERVIEKLNLAAVPFFAGSHPAPAEPAAWTALLDSLSAYVPDAYRAYFAAAAPLNPSDDNGIANPVLDRYFHNLAVRAGDRSRVLSIRFAADNPRLAATVANTLADIYITDQVEARQRTASKEAALLDGRIEELRERIHDGQRRVEEFRTKNGVLDASGTTPVQRQLVEYSQQLLALQLRRSEIESRAKQLQQLAQAGPGGAGDSAAALESPNIQRLREQEAVAARNVAELATLYRDDHPRMQQAHAELNDIRSKIASEMNRLVTAVANQADLAKTQEATLVAKVDELRRTAEQQMASEGSFRLLELDLKMTTQLYESILSRAREAQAMAAGFEAPPVRVISRALPPDRPFYPNKPLLVAATAVVATLIGVLLAFVLEFLDVGFRTRHQIAALTGLETVASIPRLARLTRARRLSDMRDVLRRQPLFAEAIRYVRVSLALAPASAAPVRSILVTSALSGEGKTFTSRALAVTFAMGGKRVITVDCDLRQRARAWSRRTDAMSKPGLADFLTGTAEADAIIGIDPATALHHIDCGDTKSLADAPILLESSRMRFLLRALSEKYDMVILDSPPLGMFPDALVLQQEVDKVLFLVRWAKTRREVALEALQSIIQSGRQDPVVGLTQVDQKQINRYEYTGHTPQPHGDNHPVRREAA